VNPLSNPRAKIQNPKWALIATLLLGAAPLLALDYPVLTPDPAAFAARREKFMAKLPPNAIAVLRSGPRRTLSNDTGYIYRQDSDFYYLTGIDENDVTAVFRPNAPDKLRYVLFMPARDRAREAWVGARVGPDEAVKVYGADAAFLATDFNGKMRIEREYGQPVGGYLNGVEALYLSDGSDTEWLAKFREDFDPLKPGRRGGPATVIDARSLIHEMRVIKDAEDLRFIRRAAEMSAAAHTRAMAAAAPGKYEFEVQQALDGYCSANGARRMAYPSIVGSGPNTCTLHYDQSSRQMKDGELLLNDSGGEYGNYATDITRTYPVNGRFTPEQRAIYEIVLGAQKAALAIVKPGATHEDIEQKVARVQAEGLVKLGLLSGDPAELVKTQAQRKLTLHGVSHWVGLDVHDAGAYWANGKPRVLEPGMVFTIEPGIYIPANTAGVDPKWWNIGVRIEDTILVKPDGTADCLSCGAPREVADVEKAVQSGRQIRAAGGR
jgi:Xaa-Pro aminopeptidase